MTASRVRAVIARGAVAVALVATAGVATSGPATAGLADPAAAGIGHGKPRTEYVVQELGSLDGASAGISVNNRGWVAGHSRVAGGDMHATLWRDGSVTDLGTLGGPNSAVLWPVKNDRGLVVGVAETDEIDPRDEAWSCSAFFGADTEHACRGFVWRDGEMTELPTLGGTHGFAAGANNREQVVGWAETRDPDPKCNEPQVLGFRAVQWDLRRDSHRALPPLTGDTASSATAINDFGQVVGISGICSNAVGGFSARHAVMWENGEVTELGDLGGVAWNTPMAINEWGTVVGFANQSARDEGNFNVMAFRWTRWGGVKPLGVLPGDDTSQALGVNNWGQVVGISSGEDNRAFIWRHGELTDLHTLAPDYEGHLLYANDINDRGVITGAAVSAATGETVAYQATPTLRR